MARWLEELSQYPILHIEHRDGRKHINSDALSRCIDEHSHWKLEDYDIDPSKLPCGGCDKCVKMHNEWAPFVENVDDTVPLSKIQGTRVSDSYDSPNISQHLVNGHNSAVSNISVMNLEVSVPPVKIDTQTKVQVKDTEVNKGISPGWSAERLAGLSNLCVEKTVGRDETTHQQFDLANGCSISVSDTLVVNPGSSAPSVKADSSSLACGSSGNARVSDCQRCCSQDSGEENQTSELDEFLATIANACEVTDESLLEEFDFSNIDSTLDGGLDIIVSVDGVYHGGEEKDEVVDIRAVKHSMTGGHNTSWGFDIEDVIEAQKEEKEFKFILEWLASSKSKIPDAADLLLANPATKFYCINKECITEIDKGLYYKDPVTEEPLLLVPTSMRNITISLHHDLPSSGHQGYERTKARLIERFFWYGMSRDVKNFVVGCEICNQNKKRNKTPRSPLTQYHAGGPMERVHLDVLGPLPKTPRGYEYCLVMVDQFTKWVECIPMPNQTAETVARTAVDHFFSRFGFPFQIFTDQGSNFQSKLFDQLCKILEIHRARTTPYRPSANGQVERYNRTLVETVRCFIGKSQNSWDLKLQQIAGALRAAVNRQTGKSANVMMLGKKRNTPAHLMYPLPKQEYKDTDGYVAELVQNMHDAHEFARKKLETSLTNMKRDYDVKVFEKQYKVGDPVYILDTATIKGKCRKLMSPWKGPGVISKKITPYVYQVKLRNSVIVINHDRIKPCKNAKLPAWINNWKPDDSDDEEDDDTPYCVCREPYYGRFMIQCDICDEWYHGSCVNVSPSDAVHIDKFKCPECAQIS
jgi:transposase InsO family protein